MFLSQLRDALLQRLDFGFRVVPFGMFGFDHFGRGETSVGLSSPGQPTAGNPLFRRTFYIGINDPGTFTISKLPVAMIVSNKFFFSDDGLSIMVIIVNIVMKIALILLFIDC